MKKTNALRILERHGVPYETVEYIYDQADMSVQLLAAQNKLQLSLIYKTLVAKGDKTGPLVAVIPGHTNLIYKAFAKASGNRKAAMVPLKELTELTGYVRGGCSPLGMKKLFPTYIDQSAIEHEYMYVNAGKRGILMRVNPRELAKLAKASFAEIATTPPDH